MARNPVVASVTNVTASWSAKESWVSTVIDVISWVRSGIAGVGSDGRHARQRSGARGGQEEPGEDQRDADEMEQMHMLAERDERQHGREHRDEMERDAGDGSAERGDTMVPENEGDERREQSDVNDRGDRA